MSSPTETEYGVFNPNQGPINQGQDDNFYQKFSVTQSTFGIGVNLSPDAIITFDVQSIFMLNEAAATSTTSVVEYSFNGNVVHGELDSSLPSRGIVFDNRHVNMLWFRIKQGSAGPVTIRVDAWATR